jgi:hypothetical protein
MIDAGPRRKFTLADVMVLVAALALGAPLARGYLREIGSHVGVSRELSAANGLRVLTLAIAASAPCGTTESAALLGLRFIAPRPTRRRLARQPGFVAVSVSTFLAALCLGVVVGLVYLSAPSMTAANLQFYWVLFVPILVGPGVAASWLTLRLSWRRRPATDWVERCGRGLGWYWIVAVPFSLWVLLN